MAFKISDVYGYGTAKLGDVEVSEGTLQTLNSYARVTKIDELDDTKIVIDFDNAFIGDYEKFEAGNDILIHVSAAATETEYLGKYMFAKILLVSPATSIITLDKNFTDLLPRDQFDFYNVQIVTIANFDCLYLKKDGVIAPQAFTPYKMYGGIVAARVFDSIRFEGGHINLVDAGIPANWKESLRPLTEQETAANGEGDTAKFSGQENFITADRFLLNAGDGAAFIIAKNFYGSEVSRIGNVDTHGANFCRGADNSVGVRPSNITNKGGSTILICAENIFNFDPKMIAKYRDANSFEGKGLCRCYIASNTILRADEGLHAYDVISKPQRVVTDLNIYDFGLGTFGDVVNPQKNLQNTAQVTALNQGGHRLTLANETNNGLAPILEGAMVLVQVIQKSSLVTEHAGEFIKATILERGENYVIIDYPAPNVDLADYLVQIITVPQFENFTLNQSYTATPAFNGRTGGVFAIAVSDTCNLRGGKINLTGKGGAEPYGYNGLAYIGNAQNSKKLPLGAGNGSVFILAKKLLLDDNSRIGATYSGLGENDRYGGTSSDANLGGGYAGDANSEKLVGASGGGYIGGGAATTNFGIGGSGASGGTSADASELQRNKIVGGYGSNGEDNNGYAGGKQGGHIFIVADKIEGFTQAAISTGGGAGVGAMPGGSSYGGGGGKSSGGSGGFAFIYTN